MRPSNAALLLACALCSPVGAQSPSPAVAAAGPAAAPGAAPLDAPLGAVVLRVTGRIGAKNSPDAALLDMALIERLPQTVVATHTPWHQGKVQFKGPLLRDVLALVQAQGDTLVATALNDFVATIPAKDAADHAVILAHSADGKRLTVRDKGPLFVVYPFDQTRALKSSTYYARSVWQLHHIDVR